MTHSSGIYETKDLKDAINYAKSGNTRLIKIIIDSEKLCLDKVLRTKKNWITDYDTFVLQCVKEDQACYLVYKLDSKFTDGSPEWIFITYVPENAATRQKMIYASTKTIMKKALSDLHIKNEFSATTLAECTYEGYQQFLKSLAAPKPLTRAEEELIIIRQNEEEMKKQGKRQTMQSVTFPISPELNEKLQLFCKFEINYIQMSLEFSKEIVSLDSAETIDIKQLPEKTNSLSPRYHLFKFAHHSKGKKRISTVFIHSIPEGKSTIKEKMLYSSCKLPLVQSIEKCFGILIDKKIETDCPKDLTVEFLIDQVA